MADFLLLETGDYLLLESGDRLILEAADVTNPNFTRCRADALTRDVVHKSRPTFDTEGRQVRYPWELH